MTIEEALKRYLLADTALAALVGTRVYPDQGIPQSNTVWPCLTWQAQGSDRRHHLTGDASEIERDSFELEVHGPRQEQCTEVRDRLRAMFSGTACRGRWGGDDGVLVRGGLFVDVYQNTDQPPAGGEKRPRGLRCNVTVVWKRGA